MEVSHKELKEKYHSLSNEALMDVVRKGGLTDMAETVLEEEFSLRNMPKPKVPLEDTSKKNTNKGLLVSLLSLLNGKASLVVSFWYFFFCGGILVRLITVFAIITKDILLIYGSLILQIAYVFLSLIAVWRCAKNTKNKLWGYIARIITFLAFGFYFITLGSQF